MTMIAPPPPELLPPEAAGPPQARWSELNREFLEFVARNPHYLSRDAYGTLYGQEWLKKYSIQPWPLFAGAEQYREIERIGLGMHRLMKSVLARFLEGDRARIAEFYRAAAGAEGWDDYAVYLDEESMELLLEEPSGVPGAPSRADYVEDHRDGHLKCVEFNSGGSLGGLQISAIGELYLAAPPIARFLREQERRARAPDTLRFFFQSIVEETARLGIWTGGDFNLALVMFPNEPAWVALHPTELYSRELCRALEAVGSTSTGTVLHCGMDDFVQVGNSLTVAGRTVHAVYELYSGSADGRRLFRHFKAGRINLYSGPVKVILSDKRNLALISENARSDEFTAAERAFIERHIPWTRRVLPGHTTTFHGRTLRLPDDLVELREELVLKKASSIGGRFVHIGTHRTDAEWRAVISQALREGDWVVQERLELVPHCFHSPDAGPVRHDMVWGLFVFGDHFGGALLRMQPSSRSHGVVNTFQGAEIGLVLELVR